MTNAARRVLREARAAGLRFEFDDCGALEFRGPTKVLHEFKPRVDAHAASITALVQAEAKDAWNDALDVIARAERSSRRRAGQAGH